MNISVIIPALNEADEIAGTIEACFSSDTKSLIKEIIVSDGGSSDQTVDIALRTGARCLSSKQSGRAIQMNLGASEAHGDILLFVHADTRLPLGWSESISDAVDRGFGAGCFQLGFGHRSFIMRFYGWLTRFDMDFMRFGDQGLFILREHFDKLGGFREDHRVLEDNEFTRRIRKAGIKFKVMGKVAITSPRRYLEQGKIRLQLIFVVIYLMWRLGFSQDKLIAFYRRMVANRVPE